MNKNTINITNFKSQFGEDKILFEHFGKKNDGFYVEVGALDGIYVSNTYFFEQIGWQGILIEPIPEAAQKCALARPRSQVVCCAALAPDSPAEIEFEVVEGWEALSATSVNRERLHEYQPQMRKIVVQAKTLDTILEQASMRKIDFLTIDVEGHEWDVLQGFTIDRWQPEIVIIERWSTLPDQNIMQYMHQNNYIYKRTTGGLNDWFHRAKCGDANKINYRLFTFFSLYLPAQIWQKVKSLRRALLKTFGL
jgi:FkbM family methyltransferase